MKSSSAYQFNPVMRNGIWKQGLAINLIGQPQPERHSAAKKLQRDE
jgi:hypothetical protein